MPSHRRARLASVFCAIVAGLSGCADGDEDDAGAVATTSTTSSAVTETTTPQPGERATPAPRPEGSDEKAAAEAGRPLSTDQVTIAVLTRSGSPEQGCEELVTERFVREAYGSRQGCLASREAGGLAKTLEGTFSEYSNRATGTVVPRGGPYDGVEVEVELLADPASEGSWLLDSLRADVPAGP